MRYSLANYILTIKSNDPVGEQVFGPEFSIGGEGSYNDSIDISLDHDLWTMSSYSTGGWVHNKNLSKTGKVQVTLNQLSLAVQKLKSICETFYGGDYKGFTLTLNDSKGNQICECIDCMIANIPSQSYRESASNQTWTFNSGKITYN